MLTTLRNKWHDYFISLLEPVAAKSKDPRTKVGCIVVGKNNEIKITSFNGFPIGVHDSKDRYENREIKYKFITHAEANAVSLAARNGISLDGCKIYLPWFPCSSCTKLVIQSGIVEVIVDGKDFKEKLEHWKSWEEDIAVSRTMLMEAQVKLTIYGT